ncbi:MAG: fibronectin type III domain-containing protein [Candidatus Altiarchaeia archaeon]
MAAQKKNIVAAGLIAAAFIGIVLFSGPITALNVTITPDQSSYTRGSGVALFRANLTINTGERVPVNYVELGLQAPSASTPTFCNLPAVDTNNYNCSGNIINVSVQTTNYTETYGYGYREAAWNSSNYAWGYGYGYGGSPSTVLGYVIRWAIPSDAEIGTYTASFTVFTTSNATFVGYSSFAVSAPTTTTIPVPQTTTTTTTSSSTTTTTRVAADAPMIHNVDVKDVSTGSVTVIWDTNKDGDSLVEYGTTTSYGQTQSSASMTTNHAVTLTGLQADTTYHFLVKSSVDGMTGTTGDYTFTTSKVYTDTITVEANESTEVDVPDTSVKIDIVTDVTVENASINVSTSSNSQTGSELSVPGLNKFVKIEVSPELAAAITSVIIRIDYTDEEVEAAGINESTMGIYWYSGSEWVKLTTALSWVNAVGIDTVQNYVWANVTHFSDYSVGGNLTACEDLKGNYAPCDEITLEEVLDLIDLWIRDEATISEVIALIDAWATSS